MSRKLLVLGLLIVVVVSPLFVSRQEILQQPSFSIASAYNDKLEFKQAQPIFISELTFLLESLKTAKTKGWNGDDPLPVSVDDFDAQLMKRFEEREQDRQQGTVIPDELADLYFSESAQQEMRWLIRKIREEYLDYAKNQGVAQKYLDEINAITLPDDGPRLYYFANRKYPDIESTNVHTFERTRKHSQLQMDVYASNVYKISKEIEDSRILGTDLRACRDMALRYVVYHEMTHVLQHAFDVVHAPANAKNDLMPWLYAPKSMLDVDSTHYQSWGSQSDSVLRDSNNMQIAKESQAEGISVSMVFDVYNLSAVQRQLFWEYHFGTLDQGTEAINEFFSLLKTWYPEINPNKFAHILPTDDELFLNMHQRLDGYLAVHLGYLNPIRPEETDKFWNYLGK